MADYPRILVDVDTQRDFMEPAGKLYVPQAEQITEALEQLFAYAARAGVPVFSSVDDHPPGDAEFDEFGEHCLSGTPGQEKIPITLMERCLTLQPTDPAPVGGFAPLLQEYQQIVFPKPTLSAFGNPHFAEAVDTLDVGEYLVFGVATDYCVVQAAAELLQRNKRVLVIADAVRALTPQTEIEACELLAFLGAQWVKTADVVNTPPEHIEKQA